MDYEKATIYAINVTEFQNTQPKTGVPWSALNNNAFPHLCWLAHLHTVSHLIFIQFQYSVRTVRVMKEINKTKQNNTSREDTLCLSRKT